MHISNQSALFLSSDLRLLVSMWKTSKGGTQDRPQNVTRGSLKDGNPKIPSFLQMRDFRSNAKKIRRDKRDRNSGGRSGTSK